ncbi:MAG: CPBP family intramembrane metalloprotease [Eubacteriales bacterium]|nr:CPBP family intramembrane metalloprotease [Eubacteriales bacterium]
MLKKLYEKSEIWFALFWIILYVVGATTGDVISEMVGYDKIITLPIVAILSISMLIYVKKNNLMEYYGLCKVKRPAKTFLYFIPLLLIFSINIWDGIKPNGDVMQAVIHIVFMVLVGFAEELLFRGFLFKAMAKDGLKSAIIVSSITFGIGHVANVVNGNAGLFPTLLQMGYATAVGFLFVIIMMKGQSILPCMIAHGFNNALSFFANEEAITSEKEILMAFIFGGLSLLYAAYIIWKTKDEGHESNSSITGRA